MKHFKWTFWRIGKAKYYSEWDAGAECRTNTGRWVYLFRGLWFRVDSKDYTKVE